METAVAVAAALIALAFAFSTYERWTLRGRRHELAWSLALFQFAIAAAALAAGSGIGWNGPIFRAFFLFGAIVNVPWLALGTVYLLAGERRGDRVAAGIALFTAFAAGVLMTAQFTAPLPAEELARGKDVFEALPRILAAVGSGAGALVVFAGAAWSAVRFLRTVPRMALANVLIALGTLILSASGLLNSVLGEMLAFSVTLAVGVAVLFGGFLIATSGGGRPRVRPAPALSPGLGATASRQDHEAVRRQR
jgi:hypothetical protein